MAEESVALSEESDGANAPPLKASTRTRSQQRIGRRLSSLLRMPSSAAKHINADQLASVVREGDLFIFKGKQVHDAVIRCCTRSSYNHVALVVNVGNELQLFESTAVGVIVCPLEFYMNSYYWTHMSQRFHRVVVRQLYTRSGRGISRDMRAELARYQDEMLGRAFNLNPISYMQAILELPMTEDLTAVFCSELVAGAYKRMGLLPPEIPAGRYLPRHFASARGAPLKLRNEARLGPERTILFQESPLFEASGSAGELEGSTIFASANARRTFASELSLGAEESRGSALSPDTARCASELSLGAEESRGSALSPPSLSSPSVAASETAPAAACPSHGPRAAFASKTSELSPPPPGVDVPTSAAASAAATSPSRAVGVQSSTTPSTAAFELSVAQISHRAPSRLPSMLSWIGGGPSRQASLVPTVRAMDPDVAKALLTHAFAVYMLRRWMRRCLRARARRLASAAGVAAGVAAGAGAGDVAAHSVRDNPHEPASAVGATMAQASAECEVSEIRVQMGANCE